MSGERLDEPRAFAIDDWAIAYGVTCVVCPGCAFTFANEHTDDTPQGGYTCPCCSTTTALASRTEPEAANE